MKANQIICGDALEVLKTLPDQSVHCCVSSPPYWGLRDYGVEGQLGLEKTPEEYTERMTELFREVRRVLRDDGTLWLNLGDSWAHSQPGRNNNRRGEQIARPNSYGARVGGIKGSRRQHGGLKDKDLVGIPWRSAFALQADGWYLRSDIIWAKRSCMPESVKDRPTKSHEYIFLMSKKKKYYYDSETIKEEARVREDSRPFGTAGGNRHGDEGRVYAPPSGKHSKQPTQSGGRRVVENVKKARVAGADHDYPFGHTKNKRDVWSVATQPYPEAHFATFPEELIIPCIKAGCPEGGIVLDPFMGSGTTALVALKLGRKYLGIELNPDYIKLAEKRLKDKMGLFL